MACKQQKLRACRKFLSDAVDAIRTGWRQAPDRGYRNAVKSYRLEGRLKV